MIGSTHEFSLTPEPDDGPVTVTRDLIIRPEDREEFLALVKEYRLIFLRLSASAPNAEKIPCLPSESFFGRIEHSN